MAIGDFTTEVADELLQDREPPCLSLYQPTHRSFPDTQQNPIRYKNLLRELEQSLARGYPESQYRALLEPMQRLLYDDHFWTRMLEALAVFSAAGVFRVYRLQRVTPQLAVVADRFQLKPLLRILQSVDRYQVLGIDRSAIRLFEGNRDALDEIEPAPGVPRTIAEALGEELSQPYLTGSTHRGGAQGAMFHGHGGRKDELGLDEERFFRVIDRAIQEHYSNVSHLPLVLAALPQHQALFRRISRNPFLADTGVDVHPDSLSIDELRERAWRAIEPQYRAHIERLVQQFGDARTKGLGSDVLPDIAQAIAHGRVATLLVDADKHIGGRVHPDGAIETGDLSDPEIGDLLDELGELTLRRGGAMLVLPADRMPTDSGAAAIYRY